MKNITLVLGASTKPERYSYRAVKTLQKHKIPVIAIGRKEARVDGVSILKGTPVLPAKIHTITLYLNARNQEVYYDYILSLKPARIIFNPGTRNQELAALACKNGIEVINDCMLAMLNTGQF